jgi:hypothetical protein
MGVTLVRQTERALLARATPVLPLARAAQARLHGAPQLSTDQRARLDPQLTAALAAQHRIAHPSRRLTQGNVVTHRNIVNADDPTMAPIGQGKSNGAVQFGRNAGMLAEPAAGFIFALPVPVGHPCAASDVQPWVDKVPPAIARLATDPRPALYARAGDLAFHDASLCAALHRQGMRTGGIPNTVDPLPPSPTPADVQRLLSEEAWPRPRTPCQVHLAYACGYRRPVVESILASLMGRGAARLTDKGQRGAVIHIGMAVMAHNAATLVRIHAYRLSKRARTFRRRLRLRCRNINPCNASIN